MNIHIRLIKDQNNHTTNKHCFRAVSDLYAVDLTAITEYMTLVQSIKASRQQFIKVSINLILCIYIYLHLLGFFDTYPVYWFAGKSLPPGPVGSIRTNNHPYITNTRKAKGGGGEARHLMRQCHDYFSGNYTFGEYIQNDNLMYIRPTPSTTPHSHPNYNIP